MSMIFFYVENDYLVLLFVDEMISYKLEADLLRLKKKNQQKDEQQQPPTQFNYDYFLNGNEQMKNNNNQM